MMQTIKTSLFLTIFSIFILSANAQSYLLRYNFKVGEEFSYVFQMNSEVKQNILGQKLDMNIDMNFKINNLITAVEDSIFYMETTYERFYSNISYMKMNIIMDNTGEENILNNLAAVLVGTTLKTKLNNKGELLEVKGFEEIHKKMNLLKIKYPQPEIEKIVDEFKKEYNEKEFKKMFEFNSKIFPEHPVKINESWIIDKETTGKYNFQISSKFTLDAVNDSAYVIKINSSIENGEIKMNSPNATFSHGIMTVDGTMEGTMKIRKSNGWFYLFDVKQFMEGVVDFYEHQKDEEAILNYPITLNSRIQIH